jgi:lipopolysaccharide cholinephosphotransferase
MELKDNQERGETALRQAQLVMLRMLKVVDRICKKHNLNYWIDTGTLLGAVRHEGFIPWDDDLDIGMPRKDYERFIEILEDELPDDIHFQMKGSVNNCKWRWIKLRDKYSTLVQRSEQGRNVDYHQGIFIDIFPYDLVRKDFIWPKLILNRRFKFAPNKWVRKFYPFFNILSLVPVKLFGYNRMKKWIINSYSKGKGNKVATGLDITLMFFCFDSDAVFPLKRIKFEDGEFSCPNNCHAYLTQMYGDYMQVPPEKERVVHAAKILPFTRCNHPDTLTYHPLNA